MSNQPGLVPVQSWAENPGFFCLSGLSGSASVSPWRKNRGSGCASEQLPMVRWLQSHSLMLPFRALSCPFASFVLQTLGYSVFAWFFT